MDSLFIFLWGIFVAVLIFRVDVHLIDNFDTKYHWIEGVLPILLIALIVLTLITQKWYYILAGILYPVLMIFWFLPKVILSKGKIYLFGKYINYLFKKMTNLRLTIINYTLFIVTLLLLLLLDNDYLSIFSTLVGSYFYIRYLYKYIASTFRPTYLFGENLQNWFKKIIETKEESNKKLIEFVLTKTESSNTKVVDVSEMKVTLVEEESLNPEEKQQVEALQQAINNDESKKLTRLVMLNYCLKYLSGNLNNFKGQKAFLLSWLLQLFYYIFISVVYFTFINYQLYNLDSNHFNVITDPNIFDFFYYSFKTITFNNIDSITPSSVMSKSFELFSFLTVGVFLFVVIVSVFFSLNQQKIKDNVRLATEICDAQNKLLIEHVKSEFGTDIETAKKEITEIGSSLQKLKDLLDKIF